MTQKELTQSLWPRIRGRLFHYYFVLRRPMTLGVRALVYDEANNSVFLVRHTYVPGWYLPGGGVETGETFEEAIAKELHEEGNIVLTSAPKLVSIHFNRNTSKRDHIALYLCKDFTQTAPKMPDGEIAESGFFALDSLPETITRGTRARLAEVFEGATLSADW